MEQFAILHEFETTQFLVEKDFDSDELIIKLKFFSEGLGCIMSQKLSYSETDEDVYNEAFEKFKDKDFSESIMLNAQAAFLNQVD